MCIDIYMNVGVSRIIKVERLVDKRLLLESSLPAKHVDSYRKRFPLTRHQIYTASCIGTDSYLDVQHLHALKWVVAWRSTLDVYQYGSSHIKNGRHAKMIMWIIDKHIPSFGCIRDVKMTIQKPWKMYCAFKYVHGPTMTALVFGNRLCFSKILALSQGDRKNVWKTPRVFRPQSDRMNAWSTCCLWNFEDARFAMKRCPLSLGSTSVHSLLRFSCMGTSDHLAFFVHLVCHFGVKQISSILEARWTQVGNHIGEVAQWCNFF